MMGIMILNHGCQIRHNRDSSSRNLFGKSNQKLTSIISKG